MADNLTAYEGKAMIGGCLSKPSPYAAKDTNALRELSALSAPVNAPLRGITPRKTNSILPETRSVAERINPAKTEISSMPMGTCCAIRDCIDASPGSLAKNAVEITSSKRTAWLAQKGIHEKLMSGDARSAFESIKRNGMQNTKTLKTLRPLSDITSARLRGSINTTPSASSGGDSRTPNDGEPIAAPIIIDMQPTTRDALRHGVQQTLNAQTRSGALPQTAAMLERKAQRVRTRRQSGKPSLQSSEACVSRVPRSASSRRITSSRSREAAAITLSTSRGFASRAILASARAWLPDYSIPSSTVCTSSRSFVENKSEESHV
jgi:hypothetical protein